MHPDKNPVLRLVRRVVPSTDEYDGQKLFSRKTGKLLATPLFAVLILVETTDVVFAVDSIPAILAVSREPFIVFASNAFAILGLRALYFLLAGMAGRFRYLNVGLGVILAFVGLKMLLVKVIHLPTWVSLAFITVVLTVTILTSLRAERRDPRPATDRPPSPAVAARRAAGGAGRAMSTRDRRPSARPERAESEIVIATGGRVGPSGRERGVVATERSRRPERPRADVVASEPDGTRS